MATQDIEKLISELQKGQQELARRDHEHDEHITILLGQVVTLLPEVRELKAQVNERFEHVESLLHSHTELLNMILERLPAKE